MNKTLTKLLILFSLLLTITSTSTIITDTAQDIVLCSNFPLKDGSLE